jgi:hypothetical protein
MYQIKQGDKVLAQAEDRNEAILRLKIEKEGEALFYPHVDGKRIDMRLKDKNGEFHQVVTLDIVQSEGVQNG